MDDTGEGSSSENIQEQPSQAIYTSTCRGCGHVFVYPAGTPWSQVVPMVNEHWEVCPNSTRAALARLLERQDEDTNETSEGLLSGRNHDESSPTDSSATTINPEELKREERPKKRGRGRGMNEQERKRKLELDEWATDVQPTSVKCTACEKVIKLDKRSTYYPGLWIKHRGKCPELKRFEAIKQRQLAPRKKNNEEFIELSDTFFDFLTDTVDDAEGSNQEQNVRNEADGAPESSNSGVFGEVTGSGLEDQDQDQDQALRDAENESRQSTQSPRSSTMHDVDSQDLPGQAEATEDTNDDIEDLYW